MLHVILEKPKYYRTPKTRLRTGCTFQVWKLSAFSSSFVKMKFSCNYKAAKERRQLTSEEPRILISVGLAYAGGPLLAAPQEGAMK